MVVSICTYKASCPCQVAIYEQGSEDGLIVVHMCTGDQLQGVDTIHCDAREEQELNYTVKKDVIDIPLRHKKVY
jgi:hypothetical protein